MGLQLPWFGVTRQIPRPPQRNSWLELRSSPFSDSLRCALLHSTRLAALLLVPVWSIPLNQTYQPCFEFCEPALQRLWSDSILTLLAIHSASESGCWARRVHLPSAFPKQKSTTPNHLYRRSGVKTTPFVKKKGHPTIRANQFPASAW